MGINIYGIKDSANITIIKKDTQKPVIYADYGTQSENAWTSQQVYAMNKSTRAIRWDYDKQSTLKVSLEIFDLKWLSMLTGSDFVTGATDALKREVLTVDATNKVTLTGTPTTGSLSIFTLDTDNITHLKEQTLGTATPTSDQYTITGSAVTFNATSCPQGTQIVAYYLNAAGATSKTMTINANSFPYAVEIYADTMIRDTDQQDSYVQVHYLNAKAKGQFTLTYSASAITKLDIEFDLLKDSKSDAMATYKIIE